MVNIKNVEAEAKQAADEVKAEAKTVWGYLKSWGGKATAVISDLLKIFWPSWLKIESDWNKWTWAKRIIAVVVVLVVLAVGWAFSLDIGRLVFGGYRSAYTYGRRLEVTPTDVSSTVAKATTALSAKVDTLTVRVSKLETELASIDDKIDEAAKPKITTGSLPKRRKPPVKPASSFFNFP